MLPVWLTDSVTPNLSRAVHYTLLWGLEGVVLRTVGTSDNRVPFVNEQQLRTRLQEAELPVVAIDPGLFEGNVGEKAAWLNDLMLLDEAAAFCKRIRCRTILTGALAGTGEEFDVVMAAEVLGQAGVIAQRHEISLAVRNEALSNCASGESLADLIAAVGHPLVSAAWSPADALEAGFSPAEGLEALACRGSVALIFVRDGEGDASSWIDCIPGEGDVGWTSQFQRLSDAGFTGPACLDVRGDAPAKQGLAQATALIQLIRTTQSEL